MLRRIQCLAWTRRKRGLYQPKHMHKTRHLYLSPLRRSWMCSTCIRKGSSHIWLEFWPRWDKEVFSLFSWCPTNSLGCCFSFILGHSQLRFLPSAGARPRYKPASSFTAFAYFGSDVHHCQQKQWYGNFWVKVSSRGLHLGRMFWFCLLTTSFSLFF